MPPKNPAPKPDLPPSPPFRPLPTPALDSTALRMSYRIARGEQGVLTFEPYKSLLLPLWRFKTVPIARASLAALSAAFASYVAREDFVGADMARKFIQMGMTRARRYANHKGGRKYDRSEREVERDGGKMSERRELEKSKGHEGMEEKAAASEVFKKGWEECRADEGYQELKREFQREQKEWDKAHKGAKVEIDGQTGQVKREVEEDVEVKEESDQG